MFSISGETFKGKGNKIAFHNLEREKLNKALTLRYTISLKLNLARLL